MKAALKNTPVELRIEATRALGSLKKLGEEELLSLLAEQVQDQRSHEVAGAAAFLLGETKWTQEKFRTLAHTALATRYESPASTRLKRTLIPAIAKLGDPRAAEFLLARLGEPNATARAAAVLNLGFYSGEKQSQALSDLFLKSLVDKQVEFGEWSIQANLVTALTKIHDPIALATLNRVMSMNVSPSLKDSIQKALTDW